MDAAPRGRESIDEREVDLLVEAARVGDSWSRNLREKRGHRTARAALVSVRVGPIGHEHGLARSASRKPVRDARRDGEDPVGALAKRALEAPRFRGRIRAWRRTCRRRDTRRGTNRERFHVGPEQRMEHIRDRRVRGLSRDRRRESARMAAHDDAVQRRPSMQERGHAARIWMRTPSRSTFAERHLASRQRNPLRSQIDMAGVV